MGLIAWFRVRRLGGRDPLLRNVPDPDSNSRTDRIKRASAADVAAIAEEGDTYFSPDSPGQQQDDL